MQVFINDSEYEILMSSLFDQWKRVKEYSLEDAEMLRIIMLRIDKCHELQSKKKTASHKGQR